MNLCDIKTIRDIMSIYNLTFRKEFGQNFTEYVNKLRINRSVALLCNTSLSAEAICVSVGFKSKIHFYDVFRKHIGVTPGEFRRSQK